MYVANSNLTGFSEVSEVASQKTRTQSVVGGYANRFHKHSGHYAGSTQILEDMRLKLVLERICFSWGNYKMKAFYSLTLLTTQLT